MGTRQSENIEEIEPRICVAAFECRGCMRLHEITQTINTISEPRECFGVKVLFT